VFGLAVFGVGFLGIKYTFGTFAVPLGYIRGDELVTESRVIDCGTCVIGSQTRSTFEVHNLSGNSITLTGSSTTCGCANTADLPVTIPARSKLSITVLIEPVGDSPEFTHQLVLYTDSVRQPTLSLNLNGRRVPFGTQQ
jgi:hypothetical protein